MNKDRTFKKLIVSSGLKNRKVAEIVGRDIETVRSYSCGRSPVPLDIMQKMIDFVSKQAEIIRKIENN